MLRIIYVLLWWVRSPNIYGGRREFYLLILSTGNYENRISCSLPSNSLPTAGCTKIRNMKFFPIVQMIRGSIPETLSKLRFGGEPIQLVLRGNS